MENILKRARQKFQDTKRNYLYFKELKDDFYDKNKNCKNHIYKEYIDVVEFKMNSAFDKMQELLYIFGPKYTCYLDED